MEVRFASIDQPPTAWIWCQSQYAAAKLIYRDTGKGSRSRVHRLVYEGDFTRMRRKNQWIARPAMDPRPPMERGWALVRRAIKTQQVYDFWMGEIYKPTSLAHKRRRDEFETDFC